MEFASLRARLKELKLDLEPDFTGAKVRNGSQWLIGRTLLNKETGKTILTCSFGDFSGAGFKENWKNVSTLAPSEQKQVNAFIAESFKAAREELEKQWEELRPEIEKEWASFSETGESPYFKKKGLEDLYGCRIEKDPRGDRTIVPARDVSGALYGYQRIFSERLDLGDKFFRKGARKEACFHVLGELKDPTVIYLCEGVATAASIYDAFAEDQVVVSCFDANNLLPVAKALRAKYPDAHLVFCADHDQWPAKDGKVYHTGVKKAQAAANVVKNARVVHPHFKPEWLK